MKKRSKSAQQAIDDFWTSCAIMQGPRRASVRTERIKKLDKGEISLSEATPKGESAIGLVLKGMVTRLKNR